MNRFWALTLAASLAATATERLGAQEPSGITEPRVFPPFNPAAKICSSPVERTRTLAFAQDNERDFMKGVSSGLAAAARDRGLAYRVVLADNDATKMCRRCRPSAPIG
jgi:ribose transport system substrate-binding protein